MTFDFRVEECCSGCGVLFFSVLSKFWRADVEVGCGWGSGLLGARLSVVCFIVGCSCCSALLGTRLLLATEGCVVSVGFDLEKADFISGSLCLKSGNVLMVFGFGVGAFGAGFITIGPCAGVVVMGFALGLTKCLSLVSLSMRGARLLLPLLLACLRVPLAGESPKSKLDVNTFFLITMSLLRIIAPLQKVRVEFDCSIMLKSYRVKRGFPDALWKFLR